MSSIVNDFKMAMRNFPASVSIIATGKQGDRTGLTATAVCSLTAEPPQLAVCVNAQTETFKKIKAQGSFSINVLQAPQEELAKRFGGFDPNVVGEGKFSGGRWESGALGIPVLKDAMVAFECKLVEAIPTETHFILIGAVKQIHKSEAETALLYGDGAFGKLVPIAGA